MNDLFRILMIVAGAALILNSLFIASRHTIHTGVVMPTILGLPILSWGLFRPTAVSLLPPGTVIIPDLILAIGYTAFTVSFLAVITLICRAPAKSVPAGTDALIVLGAALKGYEVSTTLDYRLRRSAEILRQHPGLRVLVSGGQCASGTRPEAVAMAEHLERLGIARERIILEDQSRSTVENLAHCLPLLERALGRKPRLVAIVTSDYHVFRALLMARRQGYEAIGIAAPTARDVLFNNLLREYIGIFRYLLFGD